MNVRGTSMCLLCAGALFVACGSKSGNTTVFPLPYLRMIPKPIRYMSLVVIRISMVALHLPDIPGVRFRKTVSICGKKESV